MDLLKEYLPYFLMAQKAFFIACAIFYFIFAVIVAKQVTSMSKNVRDKFNPVLVAFSYLHLIFAGFLIALTSFWL